MAVQRDKTEEFRVSTIVGNCVDVIEGCVDFHLESNQTETQVGDQEVQNVADNHVGEVEVGTEIEKFKALFHLLSLPRWVFSYVNV